jgi:hypothetical protein
MRYACMLGKVDGIDTVIISGPLNAPQLLERSLNEKLRPSAL